ncbi:hypothetical protein [Caballeronia sp. LZ034LL]|uniref:hypothetical protein n=1 Tax=Caballeronia sp. LZ034LL TaxID=3038567 RepID=UPI002855B855|nr:hypothetical protein [Caballeronia sp. LZ034LL]MDR5836872.1 hypothetical protein [Caballeronia sp. LZ034LL]
MHLFFAVRLRGIFSDRLPESRDIEERISPKREGGRAKNHIKSTEFRRLPRETETLHVA